MIAEYFIDTNFWIYLQTLAKDEDLLPFKNFLLTAIPKGLATDLLVFDEFVYISKKKYRISYEKSLEFWTKVVHPSCKILSIGEEIYPILSSMLIEHSLKPADAIQVALAIYYNIKLFVSEDEDFSGIKDVSRVWFP